MFVGIQYFNYNCDYIHNYNKIYPVVITSRYQRLLAIQSASEIIFKYTGINLLSVRTIAINVICNYVDFIYVVYQ